MIDSRWRVLVTGLLAGLLLLVFQYAPALRLGFEGDDFELFSAARIGGFSPAAIFVPHRGVFLKPVVNAVWAALVPVFGSSPAPWHLFALFVHLLNALLLGHLASRLPSILAGSCRQAAGRTSAPSHPADLDPDDGRAPVSDNVGSPTPSGTFASGGSAEGAPARTLPPATADAVSARAPHGSALADSITRAGAPSNRDLLAGALAALVWSIHDRLAEPVLSLASLNHSLTFAFYLLALLALMRALRTGAARDRLLTALAMLLALFSYEVGFSVILAASLLVLMVRGSPLRVRLRTFGPPILVCAAVWAALQAAVRLGPGMTSYYAASARLAIENLSAIGLAFLHVRSDWIAPGVAAGLVIAGALAALFILARDRTVRFGLAWSLLAWLPVAPIPFFSDRYHYIAFAGLALAAGRALAILAMRSGRRESIPACESGALRVEAATALPVHEATRGEAAGSPVRTVGVRPSAAARRAGQSGVLLAAGIVCVHVLWSLAGAREQTAFWAVKEQVARMLLADASGAIAAAAKAGTGDGTGDEEILALVWWGEADFNARLIARFENQRDSLSLSGVAERIRLWPLGEVPLPSAVIPWVGEKSHPIYVRGEGIMGTVYPADLFNVAGAARGAYFRVPRPRDAAQALAEGRVRIAPLGLPILGRSWQPDLAGDLAARLAASLQANREVPVLLSVVPQGLPSPLHVAWLESVDRSAAWSAEYGPPAGSGAR